MKKKILIIILIIILLALISIGLYYFDLNRIVETPEYPARSYSINDTNNSISYTFYGDGVTQVKTVTTYLFKDNLLNEVKIEKHYPSKALAKGDVDYNNGVYVNKLVNKNNINYITLKDADSIGDIFGKTKEEIKEIYSWLEESDQFTKIN